MHSSPHRSYPEAIPFVYHRINPILCGPNDYYPVNPACIYSTGHHIRVNHNHVQGYIGDDTSSFRGLKGGFFGHHFRDKLKTTIKQDVQNRLFSPAHEKMENLLSQIKT